ncbi:hypothetical protein LMG8323_03671 [Ralstonia mannitolilytica]|nr:hypothetical protein LMG8323_03671 [Ralstonia mannitolilytica]
MCGFKQSFREGFSILEVEMPPTELGSITSGIHHCLSKYRQSTFVNVNIAVINRNTEGVRAGLRWFCVWDDLCLG